MRTTVDLPAELLQQARQQAAAEGTTDLDAVTAFFLGLGYEREGGARAERIASET